MKLIFSILILLSISLRAQAGNFNESENYMSKFLDEGYKIINVSSFHDTKDRDKGHKFKSVEVYTLYKKNKPLVICDIRHSYGSFYEVCAISDYPEK